MNPELENFDELIEKIPRIKDLFFDYFVPEIVEKTFADFGKILEKIEISSKLQKDEELLFRTGHALGVELIKLKNIAELKKYCENHNLAFPENVLDTYKRKALDQFYKETSKTNRIQ